MTLLIPRRRKSPGPCPICGLPHFSCVGGPDDVVDYPEIVDQRFAEPWRFRSLREVRKKLDSSGRMVIMWAKGMPIPPEEALRQGVVEFSELTVREQDRVRVYVERRTRGASKQVVSTSKGDDRHKR